MEKAGVKWRMQSVFGRPRGGVERGRKRAHTARSAEAASALATTKRASTALGVVPMWSRVVLVSPTYPRAIFPDFQFTDAIISTVLACDGLGGGAANSE